MAQQTDKDASTSSDLLRAFQLTVQSILALSTEIGEACLYVAVKEKLTTIGTPLYHCKIMSTAEELDNGIKEILAANENACFLHSLFQIQKTGVDESCFRLERTLASKNRTILQKLCFLPCGDWDISLKSRDGVRDDGIKTVAQICSVQNESDMLHLTAKFHEFLYKIRAFGAVKKLTFSAAVGDIKYSTDFIRREDFANAKDFTIIAKTEHYFKDFGSQRIKFTTGDWHPLLSENGEIPSKKVSFRFLASFFDAPSGETLDADINLYCAGWYGPIFRDCPKNLRRFLSILPLSKLGLTSKHVCDKPASNGLVIPDFFIKASKPKQFPSQCMIVLLLSPDHGYMKKMNFSERMEIFNGLMTNFDSVVASNKAQIQQAFLDVAEACQACYLRRDAFTRSSARVEQAISLTTSSVREIVSASASNLFRETCFDIFDVTNSHDLEDSLQRRLRDIATHKQSSTSRKRTRLDDEDCNSTSVCKNYRLGTEAYSVV